MAFHRLFLALFLGTVLPSTATAQNTQTTGIVIDASGAPIAGATVAIESGGKASKTVETGPDGRFSLEEPTDKSAVVRVRANGFAESVAPLNSGDTTLRIILYPRPLTESVTVTASRGAAGVDTAASSTIVSSAELLTSAAGAVDDALRNTPGFSLFRRSSSRVANPTTQGVTLRGVSGSGASRTLVVADGWALNDPFGSWVYWNRIPLAAVDRIEVVRGAAGDLYGADALGGVIQVLTLDADKPRLRGIFEGGSHDTYRASGFGGRKFGDWALTGGAEVQRTEGVYIVAEEDRGAVDVRADSDYQSGFGAASYGGATWRATLRANFASEDRGNGTPLQVNDTEWRQFAGDLNGSLAGGFWTARVTGGSQDYFQTFSAIAANRQTERLTNDQTVPGDFFTAGGQWLRAWKAADILVGVEGRQTNAEVNGTTYPVTGAPVLTSMPDLEEQNASVYGRVRFALPSGSVARRRRPRRSLEVDALGGLFQPARLADLARQRSRIAAVLRCALVSDADAERALPWLPRRQHRHQRQPAAGAGAFDERRGRRAPRPRTGVGPHHRVQERARRCHLQHHLVDDTYLDHA